MKKTTDLISIVIPIYNVEMYLQRCIDSIINQSNNNIEIILVDDGSTDSCSSICDEYLKKDKRIKVIHKKNGGLSDARNAGIKIATGKYITFIDGDDYIDTFFVEKLYNAAISTNSDIVCCGIKAVYEDANRHKINLSDKFISLSNIDALKDMLYQKNITNSACAKLYKIDLFNNIKFPFGKICEDLATTYRLFYKASKISFTKSAYYYYYQRSDSIIHKKFNTNRMIGLEFAKEETKFIKANCPKLTKAAINREFMECYYIIKNVPLNDNYKKEINEIKNTINNRRIIVLFDFNATLKSKIIAFISYGGLHLLKKI